MSTDQNTVLSNIALAAINPIAGVLPYNLAQIQEVVTQAQQMGASMVIFSELALTGYPPEDWLLSPHFLAKCEAALATIQQQSDQIAILIGAPYRTREGVYNSAYFFAQGQRQGIYHKQHLPNYGVFDEKRYFIPGSKPTIISYNGIQYGILICEDLWHPEPAQQAKEAGAQVILSLHASPYDVYKHGQRTKILSRRAKEVKRPIVYVHHVGGQDELIFDGGSMAIDAEGHRVFQAPFFYPDLSLITLEKKPDHSVEIHPGTLLPAPTLEESLHQALVLGTRDYCHKNGFQDAVLGLSGGIDSALVLKIAVDALGPDHVMAWMMPSRYTQNISLVDAQLLSERLKTRYAVHNIELIRESFEHTIPEWITEAPSIVNENLQARIRANLLMCYSNATGAILLTTGNKSEIATGYCTLYGDMAGGFGVIKDLWKTWVYKLSNYINRDEEIIPARIIQRPPSAELKPDQIDEAALLPYPQLDAILKAYVEDRKSFAEITEMHGDQAQVERILSLVLKNEYKRRQAAPGIRVTSRAFGKDWRYPITHSFQEWEPFGLSPESGA